MDVKTRVGRSLERCLSDLNLDLLTDVYKRQDSFLFDGTIRDNILFSRPGATEEPVSYTHLSPPETMSKPAPRSDSSLRMASAELTLTE